MVFQTNALDIFLEDHWYNWYIYLITALDCPKPWKEEKVTTLPKYSKDSNFTQNLRPIGLLSRNSRKLFWK
jgi:hypothetical protein